MLSIKIKDIEFKNPICVASGTFGYGNESKDLINLSEIGCIITKSVTLEPREGNPPPRIVETHSGMLNSIGLANVGAKAFCCDKLPFLNEINTNIIINIAGSTMNEYVKVMEILEASDGNHIGYEINVSCPNVKKGGMEFGVDPDMILKLTKTLRESTDRLLIMKLSPNVTYIEEMALASESGGADAVSAINTVVGMAIDHNTGEIILNSIFGGLSGPAIKPIALANVHKIYKNVKIPIIGMGGISSVKDAIDFFRLGSKMIQIGTLNYKDPSISNRICNELKDFLVNSKLNDINQLIGNYNE